MFFKFLLVCYTSTYSLDVNIVPLDQVYSQSDISIKVLGPNHGVALGSNKSDPENVRMRREAKCDLGPSFHKYLEICDKFTDDKCLKYCILDACSQSDRLGDLYNLKIQKLWPCQKMIRSLIVVANLPPSAAMALSLDAFCATEETVYICEFFIQNEDIFIDNTSIAEIIYNEYSCDTTQRKQEPCEVIEYDCERLPRKATPQCEFVYQKRIASCANVDENNTCSVCLEFYAEFCPGDFFKEKNCDQLANVIQDVRTQIPSKENEFVFLSYILSYCDKKFRNFLRHDYICIVALQVFNDLVPVFYKQNCLPYPKYYLTPACKLMKPVPPKKIIKVEESNLLWLWILLGIAYVLLLALLVVLTIYAYFHYFDGGRERYRNKHPQPILPPNENDSLQPECRKIKNLKSSDTIKLDLFVLSIKPEKRTQPQNIYFRGSFKDGKLGIILDSSSETARPVKGDIKKKDVFDCTTTITQTVTSANAEEEEVPVLSVPGLKDKPYFAVTIAHNPDGSYIYIGRQLLVTSGRLGAHAMTFGVATPEATSIVRHFQMFLTDDDRPECMLKHGSNLYFAVTKRQESGDKKLVIKLIANEFEPRGVVLTHVTVNNNGKYYITSDRRAQRPLPTKRNLDWNGLTVLVFARHKEFIQIYAGSIAEQDFIAAVLLPPYLRLDEKIDARLELDENNVEIYIPKEGYEDSFVISC